jgi:hypothetical protein
MKSCLNRYKLKTNVKDNLFRKVTKNDEKTNKLFGMNDFLM